MLRFIATGAAPYKPLPRPLSALQSFYSSKSSSAAGSKGKKMDPKSKKPNKHGPPPLDSSSAAISHSGEHDLNDAKSRARLLAQDESVPSLNVGPNGRPLFSPAASLSHLTEYDSCSYFKFSRKRLEEVLPEGLPEGMVKEFEESMRSAVLVRKSFLELRDNFRRVVDPPLHSSAVSKVRKQIVLDGPVSCGKSISLAMLVHWAREEGWLVLYAPKGCDWTHGGYFYKDPKTDLWDTPLQAENVLKDFALFNKSLLEQLPCHIVDPIPLGEGAGVGVMKGAESMPLPEGSTLYDLVQMGIQHTHAAVGAVVRLRKELSHVKDVPVLIAIDQYNSWFTFSQYAEPLTLRSCRPVHAKELAMVNAFRSMKHNDMMVGAFSHSTAVGKLRKDLPDVPQDARVNSPRYSVDEAATVSHYYLRQRLVNREAFSEEKWKKIFFLSNGNGKEMRCLASLIQ